MNKLNKFLESIVIIFFLYLLIEPTEFANALGYDIFLVRIGSVVSLSYIIVRNVPEKFGAKLKKYIRKKFLEQHILNCLKPNLFNIIFSFLGYIYFFNINSLIYNLKNYKFLELGGIFILFYLMFSLIYMLILMFLWTIETQINANEEE